MNTMSWAYMATGQKRYMDAADTHAKGWKISQWYLSGFGQDYLTIKQTERADPTLPSAVSDLAASAVGGKLLTFTWVVSLTVRPQLSVTANVTVNCAGPSS